ncbi:MAG TPA: DUF1559 domain-containing protein [Pirellulales bacterium]|nr:DUF1559 domain-containing protein [Pirellulales bacterium]
MENLPRQNCTSLPDLRWHFSPFLPRPTSLALRNVPAARRRQRWAFTLVELLVVIAIIGILIALLLPAVQAAREAARRTQCSDNLKNLGLGCLNYASAKKTLPPGKVIASTTTGGATTACGQTNPYANWALNILPFIEETTLYRQYRFDLSNLDPTNEPVRKAILPVQSCPSDPNPPSLQLPQTQQEYSLNIPIATSSYRGVAGRGFFAATDPAEAYFDSYKAGSGGETMRALDKGPLPAIIVAPPTGATPNCEMSILSHSPVKITQITDGTSKTLLIGEYTTITQPEPVTTGGAIVSRSAFWASSVFGNSLGSVTLPAAATDTSATGCRGNPLGCNANATSITLDPDYDKCANGTYATFPQPCYRTFAGVHGGNGAINFVLCDGSVRVFLATMDIRILSCLATISGGESAELP